MSVKLSKYFTLIIYIFLIICMFVFPGCDDEDSYEKEIGIFTIHNYESDWKEALTYDYERDPYYEIYESLTAGDPSDPAFYYADPVASARLRDEDVDIRTVIPIPGDGVKPWDHYDFVFFFGHHNTIVPPHPHIEFGYSNYELGSWVRRTDFLDDVGWGHTTPYDYYVHRPITDAHIYPGSVTYLYYEYTSTLLGENYDYNGSGSDWQLRWYDPIEFQDYGQLGDSDLEWLILDGCQAVITTNLDRRTYNSSAVQIFNAVQGKIHILLGHYVANGERRSLCTFSNDLKTGTNPIQASYFDLDPEFNTSAVAAEQEPFTWETSTIQNDMWGNPVDDIPDAELFSVRWVSPHFWLWGELPVEARSGAKSLNGEQELPQNGEETLDVMEIQVSNNAVQQMLKSNTIKIRKEFPGYFVKGELPLLKLEKINKRKCNRRISKVFEVMTGKQPRQGINKTDGLLSAKMNNGGCWISLNSGSFKYTDPQNSMCLPSAINSPQAAIHIALDHLAQKNAVQLIDGEEMDVTNVAPIYNALVSAKNSEEPRELFISDYYISFGRRFQGVPVVGSNITVRINGKNQLVMIEKNWRRIVKVLEEKIPVTSQSLEELILQHPKMADVQKRMQLTPNDIRIFMQRSGYYEAGVNTRQRFLKPGCTVSFSIPPYDNLTFSQLDIPLQGQVNID